MIAMAMVISIVVRHSLQKRRPTQLDLVCVFHAAHLDEVSHNRFVDEIFARGIQHALESQNGQKAQQANNSNDPLARKPTTSTFLDIPHVTQPFGPLPHSHLQRHIAMALGRHEPSLFAEQTALLQELGLTTPWVGRSWHLSI